MARWGMLAGGGAALVMGLVAGHRLASGNGGPFIVKYPSGDPAAKGVLARLDPDLKPGREERLRVVKEDLEIAFETERFFAQSTTPLVHVTAAYRIANPTDEEIAVDFGFPILRGIYLSPLAMMPMPDVQVTLDTARVQASVISNSQIYKIIRCRSREAIDAALRGDATLAYYVERIRAVPEANRGGQRNGIVNHMKSARKWAERDAELLADYAAFDCGWEAAPRDETFRWFGMGKSFNLGALNAIGERKATQFLAHLAALLDPKASPAYEALFSAWGGDVRERSIDLTTGTIRPRELQVAATSPNPRLMQDGATDDFATYARVDYFDPNLASTDAQREVCQRILKNLPVTFTFAPMNLLHYQAKFPPKSERTVTVSYRQHAYLDTAGAESYQLAYVIHPASLWKDFGPIHLTIRAPDGVALKASVACDKAGTEEKEVRRDGSGKPVKQAYATYRAVVGDKTGELFVGIDAAGWKQAMGIETPKKQARAPANGQTAVAAAHD
jgi:hypothetical protein